MQKWEGERKVRELSGSEFTVVNDDFELTYGIKRDALLDRSRIQGISDYITKMGEAAAEHKDRLSWEFLDLQGTTALCYDGTPYPLLQSVKSANSLTIIEAGVNPGRVDSALAVSDSD